MVAAAVVGGAAIVGAGASVYSASQAAKAQSKSASQATAAEQNMYNQTRADLAPYTASGTQFNNMLTAAIPSLTANFNPTVDQLKSTPGYQFTLNQGLEATQNGFAAKGLGSSGAAVKGAADYATGLADSTWKDQLNAYLAQNQQKYNMLMGGAQLGENAAAQTGAFGTQTAQQIGANLIGSGNAQGAAAIAAGQGIADAANNATGAYLYASKNGLLG